MANLCVTAKLVRQCRSGVNRVIFGALAGCPFFPPIATKPATRENGREVPLAAVSVCSNVRQTRRRRSSRSLDPRVNLVAQCREVDRLGQEGVGATLQCSALGLGIAIGRDHDNRHVRP